MNSPQTLFDRLPLDPSGTVSWIHIGDTHITKADEQNAIDLGRIVDEINEVYAHGGVDFVFVPGDIADDGSVSAYEVFRSHLDRLKLPWCAIVGDHDVHEKGFDNFREYICPDLYGAFSIGNYRFVRLNAFSEPRPDSFIVDQEQLTWLESELKRGSAENLKAVLFLHCYPSDLKHGGEQLKKLLQEYPVLIVDMGHTHYNEISNDGTVLYTATRSTGQIEEGPVGYSLTTIDGNSVSWHFVALGEPSLVAITHPTDERLSTTRTAETSTGGPLSIRAKIWSVSELIKAEAELDSEELPLFQELGVVWRADVPTSERTIELEELTVIAQQENGEAFSSAIRLATGVQLNTDFAAIDQDNTIGEWEERGLLGTQLGPNKNGRKW